MTPYIKNMKKQKFRGFDLKCMGSDLLFVILIKDRGNNVNLMSSSSELNR